LFDHQNWCVGDNRSAPLSMATPLTYRPLIAAALLCVNVGVVAAVPITQPADESVTATFAATLDVVLHEPLIVLLRIENHFKEPVTCDLGPYRRGNIEVAVMPPGGSLQRLPKLEESGFGLAGAVSIAAGEVYSEQLLLNEWYPFDQVGSYEVDIRLNSAFKSAAGRVANPRTSDTLRFHISPRNEERLRKACEHLTVATITGSNAQAQLDAVRALSYIDDPVALPFLQQILQATIRFDSIAIEGIRRVGTPDARSALAQLAASSDEERAKLALDALRRLGIKR
jgi:hypothetical protein